MPTRSIRLTREQDAFIEEQVRQGHFHDASHMVDQALQLLELHARDDKLKLAALNAAIQVGIDQLDRGEGVEITDIDAFMDDIGREVDARLAEEAAGREAA